MWSSESAAFDSSCHIRSVCVDACAYVHTCVREEMHTCRCILDLLQVSAWGWVWSCIWDVIWELYAVLHIQKSLLRTCTILSTIFLNFQIRFSLILKNIKVEQTNIYLISAYPGNVSALKVQQWSILALFLVHKDLVCQKQYIAWNKASI